MHPKTAIQDSAQNVRAVGPGASDRWLWTVVAWTVVLLPCVVSLSGRDQFRAPKEYLLRASGIVIAAMLVYRGIFLSSRLRYDWQASKAQFFLTCAVVAWATVTTLTSLNRALSAWTLFYVVVSALFFIAATMTARNHSWTAVYVFLLPAIVNAITLILQALRIGSQFPFTQTAIRTALLGNLNDTGAYLLSPAVAAAALVSSLRARRPIHLCIVALLTIGILLTNSASAIIAYLTAAIVMATMHSIRRGVAAGIVLLLLLGLAFAFDSQIRDRVVRVQTAIDIGDYNAIASYRLTAMVAAIQMFKRHPVAGIGPGCYGLAYFDEKIAAEARHPILRASGDRSRNFGEAHSDFLQILAVSGAPGFLFLLGALISLGSLSFRSPSDHGSRRPQQEFSRLYSLPLAVGTATLMVAQFPLEVAASTVAILYGAALCTAWKPDESS